jgi:hypothetical protein
MPRVGCVRFDVPVVAQRSVRSIEKLDDAESFVNGVEEETVSGFCVTRGGGFFSFGLGHAGGPRCLLVISFCRKTDGTAVSGVWTLA